MHRIFTFISALLLALSSCTRMQEARQVVAEADSLRNVGVLYADSSRMAYAADALGKGLMPVLYPTDYARACYYYGRLLRQRGNQPAAMQCFIRGSHSRTRDHALLGRIYSNMGTMCRLEGNYQLSYDMYVLTLRQFTKACDTTHYFYALNNIAYVLAEQGEKEQAFRWLDSITNFCNNPAVITKTFETKAVAYKNTAQYDSAIHYVNLLQAGGNHEATGYMVKAQAYSYLHEKDSAVYYANMVMDMSQNWFDRNNALYILANDDEEKNKETVLQLAAERSDIQKLIEIRQGELSHAVELLQQDLNRKPDYRLLIPVAVLLSAVLAVVLTVSVRLHRKRKHLHKEITTARQQMQEYVSAKREESEQLQQLYTDRQQQMLQVIENNCEAIRQSQDWKSELHWKDYDLLCDTANKLFFMLVNKLKLCNLSEQEIRLCILVLLRQNHEQMADMLIYGKNGIGKFKYRTAKKMGTTIRNMRDFLLKLAVDGQSSDLNR